MRIFELRIHMDGEFHRIGRRFLPRIEAVSTKLSEGDVFLFYLADIIKLEV